MLLVAVALGFAGAGEAAPRAVFREGRLSLSAEAEPLDVVLGAVGAAAGVEVPAMAAGGETYSGRFSNLALADGLRRVLGGRSFLLTYGADGQPERLVVLGESAAPVVAPIATPVGAPVGTPGAAFVRPLSAEEGERFVAQRLVSRDLGARVVGVRRLGWLPAERVVVLAGQVVASERTPVVRAELATTLGAVPGGGSVGLLRQLLDDADPMVRAAALAALARQVGPEAEGKLRQVAARTGDPLAPTAARLLACAGRTDCRAE